MPNNGITNNDVDNLIEVKNFVCAIAKKVKKGGRISGFSDYEGRRCLVIILPKEWKNE